MIIYNTFSQDKLSQDDFIKDTRQLQIELLKLQQWVIQQQKRVAIIFEGRDAAGKGSTIQNLIRYLIPSNANIIELGVPTTKEHKMWFKTHDRLLPKPGMIHFFDRSWYSRALIQPVMNYCTVSQYRYFMRRVNHWESHHINQGLILIKIYLSVSKDFQELRFKMRKVDQLRYWKLSENDINARSRWDVFTKYKEQMFDHTSNPRCPWVLINSNHKKIAQLNAMHYVLSSIDYADKQPLTPCLTTNSSEKQQDIEFMGVIFKHLNDEQYKLLSKLKAQLE